MCINSKILSWSKWFIVKYILFFLWILSLLLVFCKSYKFYHDEPEYELLRKILGHGLCISRGTTPVIYLLVSVTILPVCRTFNKFLHKILRRISTVCLTIYLEKVKVIHMTFSIALVLTSGIHSVVHTINARNFIKFYDWQHQDLNWATGTNDSVFRLVFATPTGFSGCIMLLSLIVMWISSARSIRHYFYNYFLATHHLFLIVILVLLFFHPLRLSVITDLLRTKKENRESQSIHCNQTYIYNPTSVMITRTVLSLICNLSTDTLLFGNIIKFQTNVGFKCSHENYTLVEDKCHDNELFSSGERRGWIWPSIAIFIYLADAFVRFIKRNSNDVIVRDIRKLPGRAVFLRLELNKSTLKIIPGQYILLQCLNISSLEWHPFTVTKTPSKILLKSDRTFTLLIASRGDWTAELYDKVSANLCFQKNQTICKTHHTQPKFKFLIDGPFPSPLEVILKQKIALCVAGGAGVTPFIAVFHELLLKPREEPTRIHLIWVVKHMEQILWFSEVFEQLMDKFHHLKTAVVAWAPSENLCYPKLIKFDLYFKLGVPQFWEQNSPDRLDIQIYVTKNFNAQKISKYFYQKTSFLKSRIHSNRPDWHGLFNYWDFLYQKQPVAVFSSGPKSLNQEVRQICHDKNKIGYNYWFLHEGFH